MTDTINLLTTLMKSYIKGRQNKSLRNLATLALCASTYWGISNIVRFALEHRPLLKIVMRLFQQKKYKMFFPINITRPNSHYATSRHGVDGFMRVSGFHKYFEPVINIYNSKFTLLSLCGLHLNCLMSVQREDPDYVQLHYAGLTIEIDYEPLALDFVKGDKAALGFSSETELMVQLQAAPYVGCVLPLNVFEEVRLRFSTTKTINMGYLEYMLKGREIDRAHLPIIAKALEQEFRIRDFGPQFVVPVCSGGDGDVSVQILTHELDANMDASKPIGKLFNCPYKFESIVYQSNKSSEYHSFDERLLAHVKLEEWEVPKIYHIYLNEFAQYLIPRDEVHFGCPDDENTALEHQVRASQRLGYEQIKDLPDYLYCDKDTVFPKGEVYPEIKPQRMIVNPNHAKRILTGQIVRPFTTNVVKTRLKHIYAFGDAEYLQESFKRVERNDVGQGKFETDGTKMDANISSFFRSMELQLLKRYFKVEYHAHVEEVHRAQYEDTLPKTKFGNKANFRWSRRSGEGGTSTFNTLAMCFVFWCWLRENGIQAKNVPEHLGIYGGDDGLTVALFSEESLNNVANDLGLPLKIKLVPTLKPFSFLGMIKIPLMDVYSPDIVRFLSKIAFSHVKGVPAAQILYRKCFPYVRMYPDCPLIYDLCAAVLRILRASSAWKVESKYDELCRSHTGFVMDMLNQSGGGLPGPYDQHTKDLLELHALEALGMTRGDFIWVCEKYRTATSFEDFPHSYVENESMLLNCKYEALIRDLYIPGPAQSKYIIELRTETGSAVTKIINNAHKEEQKTSEEITSAVSVSSDEQANCKNVRPKGKTPKASARACLA